MHDNRGSSGSPTAADRIAMTSQNGKKRTLKILLLSDDKPNQDVIGDALGAIERYAYALDVLPQDNDALAAVATGEHDAILCDLSQPASANRQLRRVLDRRFAATPVIVLARPALAGMRSELQQTGAADVLLISSPRWCGGRSTTRWNSPRCRSGWPAWRCSTK
jgi:CheY-like chemotaxis protein